MEFLDTHQHLIYREQCGYDWTRDNETLAGRDFTLDDYEALTAGQGVVGTLFMEVDANDADYQNEARFVSSMVGKRGLLGQIAACRPETDAGFDAWLEECARLHVVGFRRILHVVPDDVSQSSRFRANVKKIGRAGFPFDICMLARQLPLALELARVCDEQQFVLDHCGVPDIAAGAFDEWARGIDALAAMPHVAVKFSGVSAYCAPGTASVERLRPWTSQVLSRFDAKRIVWGSDWPVVNLGCGLPTWIEWSRFLLAELSEDEQKAVASETARRIYGV